MSEDRAADPRSGPSHEAAECPADGGATRPNRESERLGRVLAGKYRLDAFISSGGMGSVYRATHLMLGKPVAIKVIQPGMVPSAELAQRFQREARAACQLAHPNIVAVHDLGQEPDGTLYIAMELVDGTSLKQLLARGPIASDRATRILTQLASALALAHSRGVIHRDLKPQNVMLCTDSAGRETAKLLDFGIAKSLESEELTALTSTGTVLGTPHYMSPEQAAGRPVDARSDLYSLGVMLYEMLVGEAPFHDPSVATILYKHVWEPPEPPSRKRPDLPIAAQLERIVMRCLAKDPAQRYASAAALLEELHGTASDHAGAVSDPTVVMTRPIERPTQPTAVMEGTALFAPEAGATRRSRLPLVAAGAALLLVLLGAAALALRAPWSRSSGLTALLGAGDAGAETETEPQNVSPAMARIAEPVESGSEDTRGGSLEPNALQPDATELGRGAISGAGAALSAPPSQAVDPGPVPAATEQGARGRQAAAQAAPAVRQAAQPRDRDTGSPADGPSRGAPAAAAPPVLEPPPVHDPLPDRPPVFVRCSGAPEICAVFRTALEQQLARTGLPRAAAPARAEILIDLTASAVEERAEAQFGTTFVVRTYAIELWGEAPRFEQMLDLPPVAPLSFDSRYGRERLSERARLVAAAVTDQIHSYWAGKLR
ncbi:MAG TPA: serine/threonine-protein kinase [Acidobacteriota bacterium]